MSELLGYAEWRARYIVFCEKCEEDTLPLRNGRCGFCDDVIARPEPLAGSPDGGCVVCHKPLPLAIPSNVARQRYCREACKKKAYRARVSGRAEAA